MSLEVHEEPSTGTAHLTGGPVGDCGLAFQLDTFPCFLLLLPQVKDQMGRLYFGKVKFFLEWRFPDSGVALMGVLVSGGLASGGFPSLARLIVGTCGGNKAHLEPAGGILSGRLVERIP